MVSLKLIFNVGFVIFFLLSFILNQSMADPGKSRIKRFLNFYEKAKFFIRLNTKHNMIIETRVFAQATGFRANFDIPKRKLVRQRPKVVRRDVYQNLEQLIMQHGFDGRACVLKSLCEASEVVTPQSGILLKIFKKIFTIPEGDEAYYPYLKSEQCEELNDHCPLSVMELSKYTDLS